MSTKIEWTDETWNPVTGCDHVSPGCDNCYAERIANRFGRPFIGAVELHPERLVAPLHWRKPRRVFVNSMSDLFHPDVPVAFIDQVWTVMALSPTHTFQILTKRPQRMRQVLTDAGIGIDVGGSDGGRAPALPNVWLGVSVENQRYADLRIPHLLATPAAVRFLSVEPMLGPIDLRLWLAPSPDEEIRWVITGGESGPGARPMHPQWARDVRDQCVDAGVPFFFKQWGEWLPLTGHREHMDLPSRQREWAQVDGEPGAVVRVGKKAAGRVLDGRTWDEYPQ